MKLKAPFIQLPFLFDADQLLAEINALGASSWRDHPQKYPGNFALPLISVGGNLESDGFAGPMRPTPYLERCPYLMQVMEKLGAVWGRSRLMKLSGHAEVTPHIDINYYWRERVRVHVPIVTRPSVRFLCGDDEVNMQTGECWIFDTWRMHQVINAADDERIHLVADTVGSESFWSMVDRGRIPGKDPAPADWHPEKFVATPSPSLPRLAYEAVNLPDVMTPWELREHLLFLLGETQPHEQLAQVKQIALRFINAWQGLWAQYGSDRAAWPAYREALNAFEQLMMRFAEPLQLVNTTYFMEALKGLVLFGALGDRALGRFTKGSRQTS
jgi:hypothetical protein